MREVKCQILSHYGPLVMRKSLKGLVLFMLGGFMVAMPHIYAQTSAEQANTDTSGSLEPSVQTTAVNQSAPQNLAPDTAQQNALPSNSSANNDIVVEQDLEVLKKTALELNRDLLILEEELLFPSNTQIVIFLSTDVGKFFTMDSVKLKINNKLVASSLYTPYQSDALVRGGVQRLYIGNLKQGRHEITAVYTGEGPDERKYKRAATINIEKDDDPIMLELLVQDETTNMQPAFTIKEWEL